MDLAAPLLRLAHLRSLEAGLDIRWLQANAESVPLPAASVDGVASYWLFHELPVPAMHQVIGEAWRLLRPGGFFASYDTPPPAAWSANACTWAMPRATTSRTCRGCWPRTCAGR